MKKTSSILIGLLAVATVASAQDYRKNIFGVRAGYSLSDVTNNYVDGEKITDPRSSFHVGVSDQILLSRMFPLYLETGLYLSNKGAKTNFAYDDGEGSQIKQRIELMYLQLPAMINYHFAVGRTTTIQPFFGAFYSVGLSGKLKEKYSGRITGTATTDLFHDHQQDGEMQQQRLKRSDCGLRLGVGLTLDRVYLGVGYEIGLMNIAKYPDATGKMENNCFTVSLGYNF